MDMDYIWSFLFFFLKCAVASFFILWIIRALGSLLNTEGKKEQGELEVIHLNEVLKNQKEWLDEALLSPSERLMAQKEKQRLQKAESKQKQKEAKKALKQERKQRKKNKTQEIKALNKVQDVKPSTPEVSDNLSEESLEGVNEAESTQESSSNSSDSHHQITSSSQTTPRSSESSNTTHPTSNETEDSASSTQWLPSQKEAKPRLFVLDFKGDIQASAVENLRREITALLNIQRSGDEVLVRLHNSGGYVHTHGLASSQLCRLTDHQIPLTIAVDQVAASGGYMMACVGHRIIAAPFAILGSIGVVAQVPNIHRLLKKYDVDVELHTAGQYKRTLTMIGENTEEGRAKFIDDLNSTHLLFQDFVQKQRPDLDVEKVATGETWYGSQALDVGLVDEIQTSDEFIRKALDEYEVYALSYQVKKAWGERLSLAMHSLVNGRLPEM